MHFYPLFILLCEFYWSIWLGSSILCPLLYRNQSLCIPFKRHDFFRSCVFSLLKLHACRARIRSHGFSEPIFPARITIKILTSLQSFRHHDQSARVLVSTISIHTSWILELITEILCNNPLNISSYEERGYNLGVPHSTDGFLLWSICPISDKRNKKTSNELTRFPTVNTLLNWSVIG